MIWSLFNWHHSSFRIRFFFPFHKKDDGWTKKEVFPQSTWTCKCASSSRLHGFCTLMPCMQSVAVHDQQVGQLLTWNTVNGFSPNTGSEIKYNTSFVHATRFSLLSIKSFENNFKKRQCGDWFHLRLIFGLVGLIFNFRLFDLMLDTLKQRHFLSGTQDNQVGLRLCVFLVFSQQQRQLVFTFLKRLISEPPETGLEPRHFC